MSQSTMQIRFHEEVIKFKQSMDELRLLKSVSKDLKKYKKLIKLKKYD
jgi:hypothetical protein